MKPIPLTPYRARGIWLHNQGLDRREPFGGGAEATRAAVAHLGYVQIDTINVIERCHHHILFSRIPDYKRQHLQQAQSVDKSVFEYWTHALAYVATEDLRFFLPAMRQHRREPTRWNGSVDPKDYRRVISMIRKDGPITIRDITDDELVEKEHLWASRKPSKSALQLAFWNGILTISKREGMLKTYELTNRHFGWEVPPKPATGPQVATYLLDRGLRAHGLVSAETLMHQRKRLTPELTSAIERRLRRKELVPVEIESGNAGTFWARPETIEATPNGEAGLVHILSPFDPLVIQRKRLYQFFGYEHVFEAYVAKEKRRFGYFVLPVLVGDEVVAALDLKTDRAAGKMLIQAWHWVGKGRKSLRPVIEEELGRFEQFQLAAG